MQQRWSATEKEAFAVYQSVLNFDLYSRGAKCVLYHDHKPLEPFYLRVLKYKNLLDGLWNWQTITLHLSTLKKKIMFGRCYLQVENIKYLQRTIGEPKNTSS